MGLDIILALGHPHSTPDLSETFRTICVREREIGRMRALYLTICPLRNPAFTIKRSSGLAWK
jgi:hypothetical protein